MSNSCESLSKAVEEAERLLGPNSPRSSLMALEALRRRVARSNLLAFTKYTKPDYMVNWHHRIIAEALDQVAVGRIKRLMVCVGPQVGKALEVRTPVKTPNGFVPIGTLRPGDWVIGGNGQPTRVIAVSEHFKERPVFRVRRINSTRVVSADAEHLWLVRLRHFPLTTQLFTTKKLVARQKELLVNDLDYGLGDRLRKPVRIKIAPGKNRGTTVCIQVEDPTGIFIAGLDEIPTHNSELCTRRFPAYMLGKNPDLQILAGSHTAGLAEMMNHDVQGIIDDDSYRNLFPGTSLARLGSRKKRTKDFFEIEGHKGSLRNAGAGVKIAGLPAQCGILDDPLGSEEDANSPTMRDRVWNWIVGDFMYRLPKYAPIILVNTRRHLDDPAGRFLIDMANGNGPRWTIINLPSLYTGVDPHREDPRTKPNEAIWPERQDTASLRHLRDLNPRAFAAQHQQNPMAAGSEWPAEWFNEDVWFDNWPDPRESDCVIFLDTSKGIGGRLGDYSAFAIIVRHNGLFYVDFDMRNDRNKLEMREDGVRLARWHKPHVFGVEEASGGDHFAEGLRQAFQETGVTSRIVLVNNMRPNEMGSLINTPKEQRIRFLTEFLGKGLIRFKKNSAGARLAVQQMMEFPNGLHDDGPDSLEAGIQIFKGW